MIVAAALTALGLYGVTKATEPAKTETATGQATVSNEPAGASTLAESIAAQQAREEGFIGRAFDRKGNSLYAWNQNVLDPGSVTITKFNDFKTHIADDHSAFTYNNLRGVFDHDYHRPSMPRTGTYMPLIGIPHAGAEVASGQNLSGKIALLSSNPYAMAENGHSKSKLENNSGFILSQTYGSQSQVNYDRNGEVRMSWMGLRNPWRLGGVQYQLHSSYLPPDKDQKTGAVPVAHPQKVFDVGGRPTQVTAPPMMMKSANVFNRNVRTGRSH